LAGELGSTGPDRAASKEPVPALVPDAARVTVVMITRDRCASAVRSVRALAALPERPPVIVIDNGSRDQTVAELTGRPGIQVISAGRNLGAAGRTIGVARAATPYVAFADDDSWWAPGALARAATVLDDHPRLAVLVARSLVGPGNADDPLNAALARAPLGRDDDLPGPTVVGFLACSAVVRRHAFLAAGGFHPRFGVGGEEELLALDLLAAGWGLAYVRDVVAHHHPAPAASRPRRQITMVRNQLWVCWLRRRLATVAVRTSSAAAAAVRDPLTRRGLREALSGLPWVLAERRAVPCAVEHMLRRVESGR
jgi:GT2 family glycosyltransferase